MLVLIEEFMKMNKLYFLLILILISIVIQSCLHSNPTPDIYSTDYPSSIPKKTITPTILILEGTLSTIEPLPKPTATYIPKPYLTATTENQPTLEPDRAVDEIWKLLKENAACLSPCFWGIVPGKTTSDEAKNIFTRLGLNLLYDANVRNPTKYGVIWNNNNFSVLINYNLQNLLVKNLQIKLNDNECATREGECKKLFYSPDELINQYGAPSKVTFFTEFIHDTGAPQDYFWYDMLMNYESSHLIVAYYRAKLVSAAKIEACPLTDPFESIWIWLGEDQENPPSEGAPLNVSTSMTIEQFSNLLISNQDAACFSLDVEAISSYQAEK